MNKLLDILWFLFLTLWLVFAIGWVVLVVTDIVKTHYQEIFEKQQYCEGLLSGFYGARAITYIDGFYLGEDLRLKAINKNPSTYIQKLKFYLDDCVQTNY